MSIRINARGKRATSLWRMGYVRKKIKRRGDKWGEGAKPDSLPFTCGFGTNRQTGGGGGEARLKGRGLKITEEKACKLKASLQITRVGCDKKKD